MPESTTEGWKSNPLLFGHDPTPGIVAVEIEHGAERVRVFRREAGRSGTESIPFEPFILLRDKDLLAGYKGETRSEKLTGSHPLAWRITLPNGLALENLRKHLQKKTDRVPSALDAPYLYISDMVQQYLLASGRTQFKGMGFGDLVRMQIDIETWCAPGYEFPNAKRESDRMISIALSDTTGWEHVLFGKDMKESEMIEQLNTLIRERNPDVIEGHNLFRFDLEYIQTRAKRYGVKLLWGRGGEPMESHPSRMQIGERSITYTKFEIFGRHTVDTFILVQHYDIATRELESLGLKEVAVHFGIASKDRIYLPADQINSAYEKDPEKLREYNLDDVRETRMLSDILLPSYFVQAQIFPIGFQSTMLRGNAVKIDSLFLREYLHRGHSLPLASPASPIQGGYTDILFHGIAKNVLHCDITSLYPSVMLVHRCFPKSDELGVFPNLLEDLRAFRIRAKEQVKAAQDPQERNFANALQSTFKILINSFYGYLGFDMAHFNDYEQANRVTQIGRDTIQAIMKALEAEGCRVIEVDTDGIYFMPSSPLPERDEAALMGRVTANLPEGIHLELDGRFPAMLSYKMKNYALLKAKGELLIKGSGLKSRGLERFQRQWMEEMFLLLLHGRRDAVEKLYRDFRDRIERHEFPVKLFMKTETLQESPQSYQEKVRAKKRNVAASYELALRSTKNYQAGDQVSYYVTGTSRKVKVHQACKLAAEWDPKNPDENADYYLSKLEELHEKFRPYIEAEPGQAVAVDE
ncbi:MAG: DNA polymerase II [Nitrospirae bacterium]|nr:DNA polymerase II [Nitrospirota bacterium]